MQSPLMLEEKGLCRYLSGLQLRLLRVCPGVCLSCTPYVLHSLLFPSVPPHRTDRQTPLQSPGYSDTLVISSANPRVIRPLQRTHSTIHSCPAGYDFMISQAFNAKFASPALPTTRGSAVPREAPSVMQSKGHLGGSVC